MSSLLPITRVEVHGSTPYQHEFTAAPLTGNWTIANTIQFDLVHVVSDPNPVVETLTQIFL